MIAQLSNYIFIPLCIFAFMGFVFIVILFKAVAKNLKKAKASREKATEENCDEIMEIFKGASEIARKNPEFMKYFKDKETK